jgi:GMP synthase-like glutamine amidotransferase
LKVGILKTGHPPISAIDAFGTYPEMFMRLLGPEAYDWRTYDVDGGEMPASPEDCAAYIVTGSAAGVYETDPWIGALLDFLRAARGRTKLVGVCFGHQAMAQAFGGKVIKSPKGWGIGAHDYQVTGRAPWMDDAAAIRLPASHQDQVVELPPGADVVVSSAFTPMAGLVWRDHSAISIQPHPEFDPAYATALIEARRGKVYADGEADRAVASFAGPDDRERVGRWIGAFLRG